MKPNTFRRMQTLVQAVLSLAAGRAYGCGTCGDPGTELVTVIAPGNGSGPDASTDAGRSAEAGALGDAGFAKAPTALDTSDCFTLCGGTTSSCEVLPDRVGGAAVVRCARISSCGGAGRRPEGFVLPRVHESDAVARHFVEMAWLELASVDAFERLADELARHEAPRALVRRARRAADDERSHAKKAADIARAFGADLPEATFVLSSGARGPVRDLEAIGRENAVEGCVAETFAALVVERQAETFSLDASTMSAEVVRATLRSFARDELAHAALAYAVDRWVRTKLTAEQRTSLDRAYRDEVAQLTGAAARPARVVAPLPAPDALGLPSPSLGRRLAQELFHRLRTEAA